MLSKLTLYLQKQYSLDARALAWMRICLGLVLLTDWIIRLNSFEAHYTSNGIMPTSIIFDHIWKEGYYSLFVLSDATWWTALLFALGILFSLFFTIGYFTRLSNLIIWILLCSLHARNPFILQSGDELFRIALFWSLFLPLNRFYSVDALQKNIPDKNTGAFSVAGIGLMLLVSGLYFFSAIQKSSPEWHSDGTAIYYALSLDQMALPLGKWLLGFPSVCTFLTHAVYYIELIAPILLFIPFKNYWFRFTGIILLIILHLGISLTLFVGLFFVISISTLISLLPKESVNKIISLLPTFIKKVHLLSFFAKILPSFTALRLLVDKAVQAIANFYTLTILNFSLLFVICVSIVWNLGNIRGTNITVSKPFRRMVYFLRLDENWGMFAPGVLKSDGWFVEEGTQANENKIDLNRNGAPIDYMKPEYILKYVKDDRWRKYGENLIRDEYSYLHPVYCNYLFKKWNAEHPEKIDTLRIIYMRETTLPDYKTPEIVKEVLCSCTN